MSGKKKELDYTPLPEHEPKQLEFDVPDADSPGFLKRQNRLVRFMHGLEEMEMKNTVDPNLIEDMVKFLLDFVTVPKDRDEAKEILWELSRNQYMFVMQKIQSGGDLVPPASESS